MPVEDDVEQPPADGSHGGWLSRNLLVLSGVSFLQDAASELVYPLLPIFLTTVLGAPAAAVGAVEGLAEGAASVTKLGTGVLGDRWRRRPLIAAGYGLAAVGKLIVALAFAWPVVLAGRVVDRLGKGMRGAPRDALLVEGVPRSARGRAFGVHRTADTLGAVVGPLMGLAGYAALGHRLKPVLLLAVVPAVLSVLLVAAVHEATPPARRDRSRPAWTAGVRTLPSGYWRALLPLMVFAAVNFPDALVLLRLHDIGMSVTQVILAYVTFNAVYAAGSFPAGVLADRWHPRCVYAVGLAFFVLGYGGLALVRDHAVAWLLVGLYGMFAALTDGVGKAWVSGLAGSGQQAAAQGVFQGAGGLAVLCAGVWAGLAWGADGQVPLLLAAVVATVVAVVLLAPFSPRSVRQGRAPGQGSTAAG